MPHRYTVTTRDGVELAATAFGDPRAIGEARTGHFAFFRRCAADELWPQAAEWLAAQAERCRVGRSEGVPA